LWGGGGRERDISGFDQKSESEDGGISDRYSGGIPLQILVVLLVSHPPLLAEVERTNMCIYLSFALSIVYER